MALCVVSAQPALAQDPVEPALQDQTPKVDGASEVDVASTEGSSEAGRVPVYGAPPSLNDALAVGCLIEEKDIQDINDKKALVIDEPDIVQVYDHLLCGSRNHLRAFNRTLENQGGSYTPVVLSLDAWNAIAHSPNEPCGNA